MINLTNHMYFNLSALKDPTILNHRLSIMGDRYVEVDANLIPTGKLLNAKNTSFWLWEEEKMPPPLSEKIDATPVYIHYIKR